MRASRHIFRWDLDKTYLKSDFDSVRDLVRTARASAEERENIPGAAALLRGIRADAPQGGEHFVYFLSGSPESFRKTIEKKLLIDGVAPDGVTLKPQLSNLVRGRFRAVKSQLAYKLGALLEGRAQAPVRSGETLFGDDAESDVFIYSLYAELVAGRVLESELEKILRASGAYPDEVRATRVMLESIVHEPAVERIVIHLDQLTPPVEFADFFPLAVPIYNHLQTAIVLWLDGRVRARTIADVAAELVAQFKLEPARLINSAEDILRRRRMEVELDRLASLAHELRTEAGGFEQDIARVVEGLAERAEHVHARPLPRTTEPPPARRSWLERFALEQERRARARDRKKRPKASSS
ncbi:MAG: hypothetical protein HYV07_34340 [Deltaproteobacteria bacterium]|nr:hypothetical protein [Deltaproteobacteria bacterium]